MDLCESGALHTEINEHKCVYVFGQTCEFRKKNLIGKLMSYNQYYTFQNNTLGQIYEIVLDTPITEIVLHIHEIVVTILT